MSTKQVIKTRVREVEDVVEEQYVCDGCGKVIHSFDPKIKLYDTDDKLISWFRVFRGHHDWGNDSVDSFEHEDYCDECIGKAVEEFFERSKGNRCTEFFEISHEWAYKRIPRKPRGGAT